VKLSLEEELDNLMKTKDVIGQKVFIFQDVDKWCGEWKPHHTNATYTM
jgi:hypothetical protein